MEPETTPTPGYFECGCKPGDPNPWEWGRPIKRVKRCPMHKAPYIPKTKSKPPAVSSEQIKAALRAKYTGGHYPRHHPWLWLEELRVDVGWAGHGHSRRTKMRQLHDSKGNPRVDANGRPMMKRVDHNAQALDGFAMAMWAGKKFERVAYEIKVSRSDFLNEIKMPWKREIGMEVSNSFYFATPPGLVKVEEVPEGCGLVEVHPSGHIHTRVKAPFRNADIRELPISFTVSILRRFNK